VGSEARGEIMADGCYPDDKILSPAVEITEKKKGKNNITIMELLIMKGLEFNYNFARDCERQWFGRNYAKRIEYWNLPHHRIVIWLIAHLPRIFSWVINSLYQQLMLK
jgi:hypothetical protein